MAIIRPGRVGDHVDVRVLDRVQDALRQLGTRLPPPDMQRRDDEVERREQLVRVVELAVGADLQLAAVEQPEALAGSSRAAPSPAASSAAKRSLRLRMSARSSATRSGVRPRAIASDCEWSVITW